MKRTNTKRAKWKGRPGETYDLLVASSRPLGARVNVHRWLDNGTVEVRAIRGDGRTPEFREYSNQTLEKPTPHELALAEHRALQALADARERNWEGGMTNEQRLAAVPKRPEFPHADMAGPTAVVIYGNDMAERIVGPFGSGLAADVWLSNNPQPWADVFELEPPEDPTRVFPPEPPGDDPILCADCGYIHAGDCVTD